MLFVICYLFFGGFTMAAVLEIKNVSKWFGARHILNDISFNVNEGEIFGFLGPNGAGKTTTIKMIARLLKTKHGEIFINGYNVMHQPTEALERVGGIIENPEMYNYLSGYDNLKLHARMSTNVSEKRIEEVVDHVGLRDRIKDKVKRYSLGMKQRLGIAQALLHSPNLLLLDEPTNGLDPAGIKQLRDLFKKICKEYKVAILVSSHLLGEMEQMCDKVGIISRGSMVGFKSFDEINHNKFIYHIETNDNLKALELITLTTPATILDNFIVIEMEKEQTPEIVNSITNAGVSIYSVVPKRKSLEQEYLEITLTEGLGDRS